MKKFAKLAVTLLLVCVTIFSMIVPAMAATVSKVSYSTTWNGGNKATVFYVNANNKNTTKLKYSCTTGLFYTRAGTLQEREGYFEVLIWGRNSTSQGWTYLSKTNIKDVSSTKVSMKGYTQYKVQVYAWKTTTIGKTIGGICNHSGAGWCDYSYKDLPKCTFTAYSNVKTLAK